MSVRQTRVIILILVLVFISCTEKKREPVITPWGEVQSDTIKTNKGFTLSDIINNGELIILTISGPETYYNYKGNHFGTQYLLCEKFAKKIGISIRVDLCKDTTEMIAKLRNGDADLIVFPLPKDIKDNKTLLYCGACVDSLNVQWATSIGNIELADSLNKWFKPSMYTEIQKEEKWILSSRSVKRHVYSPFVNRSEGVISHYDDIFKKYSATARWDWRLLAAQCYQESCFDPQARSWAGARGLMQIMPSTASHLGLPMTEINNPEANIRAAVKYIMELSGYFHEIQNNEERQQFVLASYNGGYFHIKDAMSLAKKNGRNPHRWRDVAPYILALQKPQYYKDPVVKYGYMRGSETVDYVDKIRQRYAQYRGVKFDGKSVNTLNQFGEKYQINPMTPRKAKRNHRFHI